ncbi:MAG: PilZ domain-containing protein [Candidatus Acidiferrales bacterium]
MTSLQPRRTDRVSLTLFLEISGTDSHGEAFSEPSKTLLINRNGAVIVFERVLTPEQIVRLRRRAPAEAHREADCRVVGEFGRQKDGFLYGIELVTADADLWGIEFPGASDSIESVARMLLQCTYCHAREVVYLNEIELRGFETNRGIARHCKTCGVPSIWTQAPNEEEDKLTARGKGRRGSDTQSNPPPEAEQRERKRMRFKTRLTACIRQSGADDELAVCEDISPLGMCFRSKRRYEADALIDVAVPYSPDAANIFLPARIVYSEKLPKAGLFRHGTEYRKVIPIHLNETTGSEG